MTYWFEEKYGISICDRDTAEIILKWGPELQYKMSTYVDIQGGLIIWNQGNSKGFPAEAIIFFNKIVKNKVFL